MNPKPSLVLLISSALVVLSGSASLIPLDFSNTAIMPDSTTVFSNAGDVWRAVNVSSIYDIDAIFTITSVSGASPKNVAFVTEPARGNNMRIRIGDSSPVGNVQVFLTVQFVDASTLNLFTGWHTGDELIVRYGDLDSDISADRTDMAGIRTDHFKQTLMSSTFWTDGTDYFALDGTSLLTLDYGSSYAPDYTVARLQEPWGSKANVVETDAFLQAPVSVGFVMDAISTVYLVVGQLSNGALGNRHLDIDMTPDFMLLIPEPSTQALVIGVLGLAAVLIARRRRK